MVGSQFGELGVMPELNLVQGGTQRAIKRVVIIPASVPIGPPFRRSSVPNENLSFIHLTTMLFWCSHTHTRNKNIFIHLFFCL